jgi:hypothetical protein
MNQDIKLYLKSLFILLEYLKNLEKLIQAILLITI